MRTVTVGRVPTTFLLGFAICGYNDSWRKEVCDDFSSVFDTECGNVVSDLIVL